MQRCSSVLAVSHSYERWNQHLRHVECFGGGNASSISIVCLGKQFVLNAKAGCLMFRVSVRLVLSVCMSTYWMEKQNCLYDACLNDSVLCSCLMSALGVKQTPKRTHQLYHLLQTSQLPASLCFGLKLVSSLTGNFYLNTLSISISDAPQDTTVIPCLVRDVVLAAMKSMARTVFLFKHRTNIVLLSGLLSVFMKVVKIPFYVTNHLKGPTHSVTILSTITGNCYNCDQRGSEGCSGPACRCKVNITNTCILWTRTG